MRIGVNWGSLDQDLLTQMMDENARAAAPRDARDVYIEAMFESALRSAALAEEFGLRHDRSSSRRRSRGVQDLVEVYRRLAARCDYPLHLGLTEAGMGMKGIVASAAALSILLSEGIGDTIRVSLTPKPGGDRTEEVLVASRSFSRSICAASRRRSPRVPAAGARRPPSSSRWRRTSRRTSASGCRNGARRIPASRS